MIKTIKKICGQIFLIFVWVFSNFSLIFAQTEELKRTAQQAGLPQQTDIPILIGRIIRIFLGFAGLMMVVLIIYGGILWTSSAGDEEKIKKAKGLISNAVIGLAIIIFSYAIAVFVVEKLAWIGGGGGSNIQP